MKAIYVCSPYRAKDEQGLQENIKLARRACELVTCMGDAPICPQLYFSQFIKERETALEAGLALVGAADELWVIGSRISDGMAAEIHEATKLGKKVRCITDPKVAEEHLLNTILMSNSEDEHGH